ncbi:glycosyl transferase family protein [Methanocaldococcus bathoardescens]|uniref:Glycosyl transferase family protein n=1 Tax=Methanocaldococcus bathoardescens TaxID=1301915 RepID=A0A076LDP0_9EURY|nr:glycosyltransferase family 2 protein [Methanocaldococcus bathoardescens]AIJ04917.1 glycosyl transferase family protein [Methanocaldococcus bathoardescens]
MAETYIVTPDYNGTRFLKDYFESLFNQTYQNFKIVFVDNSPNNDSIDYIKKNYEDKLKEGKIIIIKNPENYGFAKATNIGIKKAFEDKECKYIVCLNNDIKAEPNFLEELIKCAERHPDAGSIQPKMIWGLYPELIDSAGIEYSKNGLGFNRGAYEPVDKYNEEEEILGCCAGACLYRREALEDVKIDDEYFDEDFFAYYEDFDLALRLQWSGWKAWYCPKAIVYHYKGGTGGVISDFTVYHCGRNYTLTVFKNLPNQYIIKHFYLIILAELAQIGINLLRGKPVIIKAKIDAYKNLRKFLKKKKKIKKRVDFKDLEKLFIMKWRANIPKYVKL